jgi:hypothetical protein
MAKLQSTHVAKVLDALGIDPLTGGYIYEGGELIIDGIDDADIEAAEASLDIAALDAEQKLQEVHAKRAGAYPSIGDQLDAIWKQLAVLRMQKKLDLIEEADDVLGRILAVKRDVPKE